MAAVETPTTDKSSFYQQERRNFYELVTYNVLITFIVFESIYTFGYMCHILDQPQIFFPRFSNTIHILGLIPHVFTVVTMLYNWYNNFRFRNLFDRTSPREASTLFFIILPLLIIAIMFSFLTTVYIGLMARCQGYGKLVYSISCIVISVLILLYLIDTSSHFDYGEEWSIAFWNYVTILFVEVSMLPFLFLQVAIEQLGRFLPNLSPEFVTYPCYPIAEKFEWVIGKAYFTLTPYMLKVLAIFTTITCLYFFKPLKHHYDNLNKFKKQVNYQSIVGMPVTSSNITELSVIWILLALISLVVWTIASMVFSEAISYHCVSIVLHCIGIVAILVQIKYMLYLQSSSVNITLTQALIWIGICGKFLLDVGYFEKYLHEWYFYHDNGLAVARFFGAAVQIVEDFILNILLSMYLRKCLEKSNLTIWLITCLYILVLNLSTLVREVYSLNVMTQIDDFFRVYYFVFGLTSTGIVFTLLFRFVVSYVLISFIFFILSNEPHSPYMALSVVSSHASYP